MKPPKKMIPVLPAAQGEGSACDSAEPFALMVLGESMLPEFAEGEVLVVEPEGVAQDGSYVIAMLHGEPILRQLRRHQDRWLLHALNPRFPDAEIADLSAIKGVVIQKSRPGRRRLRKSYVD